MLSTDNQLSGIWRESYCENSFCTPTWLDFLRALSQSFPNFSRIEVLRNVTTREGHRENRRIRRCSHQPAYRLSYILQQVMFAFPRLQSAFADFGLGLHKAGTRESRLFKKHCKKLEFSLLSKGFSLWNTRNDTYAIRSSTWSSSPSGTFPVAPC